MTKALSDDDKRWLRTHPEFHIVGTTKLGRTKNTNSDNANSRAENENDQHWYEMHRTFSRKLEESKAYNEILES